MRFSSSPVPSISLGCLGRAKAADQVAIRAESIALSWASPLCAGPHLAHRFGPRTCLP
ncbi:hypothetical protein Ancab_004542, partial [Ancistrocladus abbreviatus]